MTTDATREMRRKLYVLASALEYAEFAAVAVRSAADAPEGVGGRPVLVDEIDRVRLALAKLLVWAWGAAEPQPEKQ